MNTKVLSVLFVLYSSIAAAAPDTQSTPTILHCTGETLALFGANERASTEAYLRISPKETYLEINAVGRGSFSGKPKLITSMQAVAILTLDSAIEGGKPMNANFNLNIFTGHLSVISLEQGQTSRTLFTGTCREAKPLFNP